MRTQKTFKSLYLLLIYGFLYFPILVLVVYSFNSAQYSASAWEGFTLKWYESLFRNTQLINAAKNSIILAISSATLATAIGTLGAFAFFRFKFYGKNFLYALIYIIMMSPDVIMGASLLVLFVSIKIPLGFITLLITHVTFCLPFVIITLFTRLSGFDKHIVEAAKDLGASEAATFKHIIFPMLIPAVLSGWLLSFTISLDDVIGSSFVTGSNFEVLPLKVFSLVRLGVKPEVNALSAIMFTLSLVIVIVSQILMREKTSAKKQA